MGDDWMIDTDKYEGYTEGEWDLHSMGDGWTIGQLRKIDRTLMQDAPLLLTEVKRLREGIEEMAEYMVAYHEVFPRIKDMAKELKELIK